MAQDATQDCAVKGRNGSLSAGDSVSGIIKIVCNYPHLVQEEVEFLLLANTMLLSTFLLK